MLKDCHHKPIEGTAICATCPRPDDWNQHARCLDANPEIFYPEQDDFKTIDQAIRLCMSCPVRGFCLEVGWTDRWGIFGSFTVAERERLRKAFPLPKDSASKRRIIRIIAHRL